MSDNNSSTSSSYTLDLEKILQEIGGFGKYQLMIMAYLVVNVMSNAIKNNQYVFAAGPVKYRCMVPECETSPPSFKPGTWSKFALPQEQNCYRYVAIGTSCNAESFSNRTQQCNSWVFERTNTISYEFNLACQEWKRTLVGTLRNIAYFCTIPFVSFFSDTFGRRYVLIFTAVAPMPLGVLRAFSQNYLQYIVLEFTEAFLGTGGYSTIYILALELMNHKNRAIGGSLTSCFYAVGLGLLGVVAWIVHYWRTLTIVFYAPGIIFLLYICIAHESVRWLISKGRYKEAAEILLNAARIDKKSLSVEADTTLKYFASGGHDKTISEVIQTSVKKKPLFKQVIKSKVIMFRIVVVSFWWSTVTMVYYGLTINSVSLVGNMYLNFIMTSLVEIPGYLTSLVTLDRFGRKTSIMTSFVITSVSMLLIGLISNDTVIVVLVLLGKLSISMIFCSIYIYTVELFPTSARHQLLGSAPRWAAAALCSPRKHHCWLEAFMKNLPFLLFGTLALIAALLMIFTPETLKMKLPDSIEEAENIHTTRRTEEQLVIRDTPESATSK